MDKAKHLTSWSSHANEGDRKALRLIEGRMLSDTEAGYHSRLVQNRAHATSLFVVESLSRVQLLCDTRDCSPRGSSVQGSSQARILEWAVTTSPLALPSLGGVSAQSPSEAPPRRGRAP